MATYKAARELGKLIRTQRKSGGLHLSCMRLYGHAGAYVESAYRPMAEIEAQEAQDPLLFTAAHLLENGISADEIIQKY